MKKKYVTVCVLVAVALIFFIFAGTNDNKTAKLQNGAGHIDENYTKTMEDVQGETKNTPVEERREMTIEKHIKKNYLGD